MGTQNSIHVSDELLTEMQTAAEDKTVDELAAEALRKCLADRKWQEPLEYGLERGRASGYTAEDVPNIVRENQRRHDVVEQIVAHDRAAFVFAVKVNHQHVAR
jgi:hypothetical protein